MSENSDHLDSKSAGDSSAADREGICRDYTRGVCDRQRCKYKHEKSAGHAALTDMNNGGGPVVLNFCHDYQNNSCPRPNCRFIHCTPAEEEQYKRTGELPLHLQADAIRKHQIAYGSQPPVCKNFLNGDCRRGSCKYRHITRVEHEAEIRRALKLQGPVERDHFERGEVNETLVTTTVPDTLTRHRIGFLNGATLRRNGTNYNSFGEYGPPDAKRRFFTPNKVEFVESNNFEIADCDLETRTLRINGFFNGTPQANQIVTRVDPRVLFLEEENSLLHKQIAELKKQVSDLTATNEFLLDQNAQLRVSSKRNAGSVTSVTVPAVTITNTTVPPINTSAPPPQQMIRTVTASVATVPVSIATVTTGNHPVSMGAVSMAPVQAVPAVSIAQPAAQQILAQSQQLLGDPTSQLTLASSTTQLAAIAQQNLANNLAAAQQNQPLSSQQLTSQAQQLALASTPQQLTSQAQQLALASTSQQLTSQAQQLALASTSQQLLAQQNLASSQQMALTGSTQMNGAINSIQTSQAIAMSNASQPMVSYPIMTQSVLQNGLQPH